MHVNNVSERPPLSSLIRIFLLVIIVGWMFLSQTIAIIVGSFIYEGDFISAMSDPANHPDLRDPILLTQGLGSALGLIFIPWYYLKFSENRGLGIFFKGEHQWSLVIPAVLLSVAAVAIAISPIAEWNASVAIPEWTGAFGRWAKNAEAAAEAIIKTITGNFTPTTFIFTFVVVAVIPAIGEELVFRGLIQTELQRAVKNPHMAILLGSILFSAVHFQFLGFLPRMLIGGFFGYLYFWSGNLWVAILAHFLNNGLQIVGLYLNQLGVISFDMESTESAPLPVIAIAVVIAFLLLYYLKRNFASRLTLPREAS